MMASRWGEMPITSVRRRISLFQRVAGLCKFQDPLTLMAERRGHDLPGWLAEADDTDLAPLRSFARGYRLAID